MLNDKNLRKKTLALKMKKKNLRNLGKGLKFATH